MYKVVDFDNISFSTVEEAIEALNYYKSKEVALYDMVLSQVSYDERLANRIVNDFLSELEKAVENGWLEDAEKIIKDFAGE